MNQKSPPTVLLDDSGLEVGDAAVMPNESADKELLEQKERYLRLAADFENFRKRTAQETERRAAAKKGSSNS